MLLLTGAVVAGLLTAASPCVLPILPVILGTAALGTRPVPILPAPIVTAPVATMPVAIGADAKPVTSSSGRAGDTAPLDGQLRLLVLTASLGASIVAFTVLLRAGTWLLPVPRATWSWLSGGLLVLIGLTQLIPTFGEWTTSRLRLSSAHRAVSRARTPGVRAAAVTGAALGPVFSSCSPLYAYVVATVLPASPAQGLVLLLAYVSGLCGTVLAVALAGRRAARRLRWATDPSGPVRRLVGILLLIVGLAIITGVDKAAETWAVQNLPLTALWTLDATFLPGH
jgi:cytochrome c-type biogenesis protein